MYRLPLLWPAPDHTEDDVKSNQQAPFIEYIEDNGGLLGMFTGLASQGLEDIALQFANKPNLKGRFMIVVYPGCKSSPEVLFDLLAVQRKLEPRLECRLLVINSVGWGIGQSIFYQNSENTMGFMAHGPGAGFSQPPDGPLWNSLMIRNSNGIQNQWLTWFNSTWQSEAIPLNDLTVRIPRFQMIPVDQEVQKLWDDYRQRCVQSLNSVKKEPQLEQTSNPDDNTDSQTASQQVGINQADPVEIRINELYQKGVLVAWANEKRVTPFDCPAKPDWFGIPANQTMGAITRKTEYRISIFDANDIKQLTKSRSKTRNALPMLSFSQGPNQHWMLLSMIPVFNAELKRLNDAAAAGVLIAMGEDEKTEVIDQESFIKQFVARRAQEIISDANSVYQQYYPGAYLSESVAKQIIADVSNRLNTLFKDGEITIASDYSRRTVGFVSAAEALSDASFEPAQTMLINMSEFIRKVVSNDTFVLRGAKIPPMTLLEALRSSGDYMVELGINNPRQAAYVATDELEIIKQIRQQNATNRSVCEAIFAIMDGNGDEALKKLVVED